MPSDTEAREVWSMGMNVMFLLCGAREEMRASAEETLRPVK